MLFALFVKCFFYVLYKAFLHVHYVIYKLIGTCTCTFRICVLYMYNFTQHQIYLPCCTVHLSTCAINSIRCLFNYNKCTCTSINTTVYTLKHCSMYFVDQSSDYSNCKYIGSLNRVSTHDMSFKMTLPSKSPITQPTLEWFLTSVGPNVSIGDDHFEKTFDHSVHTGKASHQYASACVHSDNLLEKISDHTVYTGKASHQYAAACVHSDNLFEKISDHTVYTGKASHQCGSECAFSDYSAVKISNHSARTGMVSHQCGSECVL